MSAIKRKIARRKHRDDSDVFLEDDHRRDSDRPDLTKGFFQKYLSKSLQNLEDLYCLDDDGEVELDSQSGISLPLTATTVTDNEGSDYEQYFAEPTHQPKVAQVLPNNNQLDKPSHHSPGSNGYTSRHGSHPRSPHRDRQMSPRARMGDGSEDVTTMTDGHDPALYNDPKISNLDQDDMFLPLDWDHTLNETDMVPDTTLMEKNPAHRSPLSHHSQLSSYSKVSHHPLTKSPRQYSGAFGDSGYGPPDYSKYPGPPESGPGSRAPGNPVPFHTKMNLTQWQQNLDSQFNLQQQMHHLQLNPAYHPSSRSGTGHDMHRHAAGTGYPMGDSNFSYGPVMSSEPTNLEGLIRAKESMLHERNIIVERQKLEIAHLRKQNDEQESIARQRIYTRSRDEGDMLFLKMQEYQYEIASLRAQLAEVSTAKMAEGDQLSRKLGEVEESQLTNEMTINELKTKLKLKEAELHEVKGQLLHSKKDYDKLKKRLTKIERYMHDLPTAEEYKESCDTDLRQQEGLLRERIVSLEASLSKAKHKAHRSKQESTDLEEKNLTLEAEMERMKKEMSKLHKALGSKDTGDPTDLELCNREDLEQLREENERHSSSVEHLKKVIDSKHRHLQKVQSEHQRALDEMDSRLLQEEGVITALRVELNNKDSALQDMTKSMKDLASQSQELYGHNLSLQESVEGLEKQVSSDKARFTGQLVKELSLCVQELQRLVELINQRAEGQEPNVSLLLGFRPSSTMSFDVDEYDESGSEDVIRAKLTQVQKLRGDIDLIRSLISDRYAEDFGSNCITQ